MTPSRVVRVLFTFLLLTALPSFATGATTEFRVLFDVDDDATTGCTVNGMAGVDQVLVTQVTDGESSMRVTRTHREVCTGSVLGGPIDIITDGWDAGWDDGRQLLNFETRIPFTAFGSEQMPATLHVGFDATRNAAVHTALLNQDGTPVHIPQPPSRRRAVGAERHITMDESVADWGRIKPAVIGLADNGNPTIRMLGILSWPDASDGHLYFAVMAYLGGDHPWADDDIYYRDPGQSIAIVAPGVLDNDGIPGDAPLTAEKVTDPARGTVSLNGDGSFTYSPTHPQLVTDDEFEYKATGGGKESNVARVIIKVNQGENPNAPQDDAYTTPEDTNKVVPGPGVLANDPHTDLLVASLFSPPSHGTVVINADGGFTYKPARNFFGTDSFVYTAAKKQGAPQGIGGNATVTITVTPVNDPPTVDPATFTIPENSPNNTIVGTVGADDVDNSALSFFIVSGNTGGAFSINPLTGQIRVANSAALDFETTPTFFLTVRVEDAENSAEALITINLTDANEPPVIVAGGTLNYTENDPPTVIDGALTVTDTDSASLTGATIVISANFAAGQDVLSFTPVGAITGLFAGNTLTLSGTDSVANYQSALQSVTYQNLSDNPSVAPRTITWQATDGSFPSTPVTSTVNVIAVNDAPVLTAGGVLSYTENQAPTAIDTTITIADLDSTTLTGATVQITGNYQNGQDVLSYVSALGITGSFSAATGTLTLTGTTTLANYQTALRNVLYNNTSDNPSTLARTVTWQVNDGGAVNNLSNLPTSTINVAAINDAPVLTSGAGSPSFTEDGAPVVVDGGIVVADVDDTNLESATVTITNLLDGASELLAANTGGTAIVANYVGGVLTLTGTDTLANYQLVLRSVTYENTSDNPTTTARSISFVVYDGDVDSNTVSKSVAVVAVNDAPVLTAGGTLSYTENDPASAIDTTITITDVDSTTMSGATAQITTNYVNGEDVLSYVTALGITGSFNAGTGTLTLSGVAPIADYQTAMRNVLYNNTSDNPSTLARTVTWQVNDGAGVNNLSNTATSTINVTAVNDAPVVTPTGGATTFTEDGAAVAIDGGLTVTDVDNANLTGATVSISANFAAGQDVLALPAPVGSITGLYNAGTGVLTLSGADTVANYQLALRSVTYANTSNNPSTAARTISFVATDGTTPSAAATKTVNVVAVNDAPAITAGGTLNYTENQAATAIDGTITVSDIDSSTISSATAQITSNYVNGEDVLSYVTALGITGSFTAGTGTLTLSGVAPIADYQTAMRNVLYNNTSDNPSTLARTITWQVNDGAGVNNLSNTATSTVNVAAVNDAPVVNAATALAYTEGTGAIVIDGTLTTTDADDTQYTGATVQITANYVNGEDILAFTNAFGITGSWTAATGTLTLTGTTTIANYQSALRTITYQNTSANPSLAPRTVTWTVTDPGAAPGSDTTTINITPVNSAPVLTAGGTLNYTENQAATAIDTTITVTDADTPNLVSATAQITGNYVNGEDVLSYVPALGITGSFNAGTGTLTLTGTTTPANWQTALRNVLYNNTSDNPSTSARTVTWQIDDGEAVDNLSNTPTSTINVAAVNDPPVVNAVANLNYTENDGAVAIDNALTVTDADNANLTGGTVQITANYVNGEDVLAFTNAFGITGVWNAGTGTLTLTGTTTVANYQSALRSITYENLSQSPSTAVRTVTWTVSDGTDPGSDTTTITVSSVNDPPVLSVTGAISYTENDPATNAATAANITDADDTNIDSATIQITGNYVNGEDVLSYAPALGITGVFTPATGTLQLTGVTTLANYITALQNVQYTNTSNAPSTLQRTLTWTVNDGGNNSNSPTSTINVTAVNDGPVHTFPAATATNEDTDLGGLVFSIADLDSGTNDIDVQITVTNGVVTLNSIAGMTSYIAGDGTLDAFIRFQGPLSAWNNALNGVTFRPSPNFSGLATIQIVTSDQGFSGTGGALGDNDTLNITVNPINDAPALTVAATPTPSYTENAAAITIATGATITDVDDTNIESATVQITGNYQNGADVLSYTTALGITGNFVAATGTLTLTGSASLANYQTALQNVQYANSSEAPSILQRTVTWTVNDGTDNSNTQTTNIDVVAVNDTPAINANNLLYTEDSGAVTMDATLTVTDPDDATLPDATVQITANYVNGEDILAFTNAFGITGSFTAATGTLTLTGPASPANFQSALRTVTYQNTSNTPSTAPRTVTWTVNDDEPSSGTDATTITVTATNDAPVLTLSGTLNYTEDDAATSIASSATITDADDTNIESATVQITGNYQNGQDVLSYATALGITGNFVAATGTLTLTGSATLADYQTALQNVKYNNTSQSPSTLARTVTFTVNDGTDNSNNQTATINVTSVNDAPVVTPTGTPLAYTENDPATAVQPSITVTDVDSANLTGATVQLTTNYQNGQDVLSYVAALGITGVFTPATGTLTLSGTTTVANYQTALQNVLYNNTSENPSQLARTVAWQVNDGAGVNNLSTVQNSTINVTAVNDAPTVVNNTFDVIGNTELRVDMVAGSTPHAAETVNDAGSFQGILFNDSDVEGDPFAVTAVGSGCGDVTAPFDCTLSSGAVVHVDANGEFSFTPGPGDTTDSFAYTVTDTPTVGTAASANGTVTFNFSEMVWYVKQGSAGNGTSISPFGNFDNLDGAGGAGDSDDAADYIFVHNSGALAASASVPLEINQHMLGEGVGLSVPVNLNGNGSPTSLVAAGTQPTVAFAGGALFTIDNAVPVEIRGLAMGGGAAVAMATSGALSGSGTLTISNNTVLGAGGAGIGINLGGGTTGALALAITNNAWNTGGTHTGNAIDIVRAAGTLNVNLSDNTNVLSTGAAGINVNGAITITGFSNNTVHANTAGQGVVVNSATFDATPGGAYQTVSGGTTTIGQSGNGVGTSGMTLTNVAGDLSFTDLDIYADNGNGFTLTGTGAVNTGAGTGTRVTVGAGVGTFNSTNGPAVDVNNATIDLQLASLQSTNTGTRGVSLVSVSDGTTAARFSAAAGGITTTAGATGAIFNVSGGNSGISFAGTINNSGTGRAVLVDSWAGDDGTDDMVFSGAITENGAGILLNANGGTRSITFSGGLTISTSTGEGFAATANTNSGGLHVTGTNTVNSTSATAVRITSTTIGSSHVTFRSVSSGNNTAAADPANGIVIDTTGSTGSFRVQGTGAANTGGTIQNTTGHAISLNSTLSPQFAWMNIQNAGRSGIDGFAVTNFTLNDTTINNVGTAAAGQYDESNISFNDNGAFTTNAVSGTVSITNNTLTNARRHGIQIENGTGTVSNVTIQNNTITSSTSAASSLGHGILILTQGTAATTAHLTTGTISGNTITYFPSGSGIQIGGGSGSGTNGTSATLGANGSPIAITGNFIGGTAGTKMGQNAIIVSFNGQNGTSNFNISNNGSVATPLQHFQGIGVSVFMGGTVSGNITVNNNRIASQQTLGAGSAGIAVQADDGPAGAGTSAANVNVTINGNNVSQNEGFGIRAIARASLATMDVTIQNNTVAAPTLANRNGIRVDSGSAVGDTTLCLNMTGNTSAGSGVNQGMGIRKQGLVAGTNDFGIVGLAPSPTTGANAAAKVTADNPAGGGTDAISGDNFVSCTQTP